MPKISIVIIVYNTEAYLPQCLDSVIGQSLKDIEIIVVNDCSPGNCREIVQEYQKTDARIKYIEHETNKGTFVARQTGILAASGEFTRFVDSDDWLDLDTCTLTYDTLQKAGADMLYNTADYYYETDERPWSTPTPSNEYEILSNTELLNQIFKYRYTWNSATKSHGSGFFTFKTSTLQSALKEWSIQKRLIIFEDFLATVGFICSSHKCVCINKKLYHYRIGSGISYVPFSPERFVSKIWDYYFVIQKTREILLSKNLWTKGYEDRTSFEYIHIFQILQGAGLQYIKKFFSLLNPDELAILFSLYLDVKKYYRRQHLLNLLGSRRFQHLEAPGIKVSLRILIKGAVSLGLSLLNKFLQIIGIGKIF